MIRLLIDGWSLVYAPASPEALHLAAVLDSHPAELQIELALPAAGEDLAWLPETIHLHQVPVSNTGWNPLKWRQKIIPRMAVQAGAEILLTSGMAAPLIAKSEVFASPAGWFLSGFGSRSDNPSRPSGLAHHLDSALGWGGLSRSRAVLWPQDLPLPASDLPWKPIPPLVQPRFLGEAASISTSAMIDMDLPETYLLYHGPLNPSSLERLTSAWSWAAGSLGSYYPLLIYGVERFGQADILRQIEVAGLADSIRLIPPHSPEFLEQLYRGCSAFLHLGTPSPWGSPLRHALACGKPVVAEADRWTEALVGTAAYLAPVNNPRLMGAAIISVVVETELADRLSAAAKDLSASWTPDRYWETLLAEFTSALA